MSGFLTFFQNLSNVNVTCVVVIQYGCWFSQILGSSWYKQISSLSPVGYLTTTRGGHASRSISRKGLHHRPQAPMACMDRFFTSGIRAPSPSPNARLTIHYLNGIQHSTTQQLYLVKVVSTVYGCFVLVMLLNISFTYLIPLEDNRPSIVITQQALEFVDSV